MKRLLIAALTLAIALVGCTSEVKESESTEIFYTEEKLNEVKQLAKQAFEYKDHYLILIQYNNKESYEFIENLSNCTKIATALYNENHKELAEIFDNLGLAGKYFSLWKDSGKLEHYADATSYYNEAERLYKKHTAPQR